MNYIFVLETIFRDQTQCYSHETQEDFERVTQCAPALFGVRNLYLLLADSLFISGMNYQAGGYIRVKRYWLITKNKTALKSLRKISSCKSGFSPAVLVP